MATQAESVSTHPSGTVAFLFSDIEGSTQRWEAHREAMADAVARHDALVQRAIDAHGGHTFKRLGDAFCAAFATVPAALAAVLAAQRALASEDFSGVDGLRARMALHAGHADERDGDYFGPAVNRVARLLAITHGGQVVLSLAAQQLAHGDLPAGASLLDLGTHRLKDLREPERVWQLNAGGLQAAFPPLRSIDALPNNLPLQPTRFRGREEELRTLEDLLAQQRAVTLVGAGGIGKTRLALQIGAELLPGYPDGVWVAELAPISDPELVSSVVAASLGMAQSTQRRVDEAIVLFLRSKRLLLVLDNCEHLLAAAAALVDAVHRDCPEVRMLATSRQPLGIAGEAIHHVAPLEASDALALFVDRAQLADSRFTLTDDTAPIVAEICRRLDGIALAIELAAARVRVLSIPNLAKRLDERFKLLTGGSRTALPRQQTLSALIGWSYDLLTPAEQRLFARLGIFAGSFDLAAAEAVCARDGIDESDVWELLVSLADKSLVVASIGGEQERYQLNESTRAYALEQLGAQREALAARHAAYFAEQAQAANERFGTGSTIAWLVAEQRDLDNDRAAMEWSLAHPEHVPLAGAIAGSLGFFWQRALTVEGRYWCQAALERVDEAAHPRIAAHSWYTLARLSSGKACFERAQRAVALFEAAGDARWAARARLQRAWGSFRMGNVEQAERDAAPALAAARACADGWGEAYALNISAVILQARGEASSRELYRQALAAYRALGNELGIASALGNLADAEFELGHVDRAEELLTEALDIDVDAKRRAGIPIPSWVSNNGAAYRIARGNLNGARVALRNALLYERDIRDQFEIAVSCQHAALIEALDGDAALAARLTGHADAQYRALAMEREYTERWGRERLAEALAQRLDGTQIETLAAEGAAWTQDRAIEEALRVTALTAACEPLERDTA